jgi:DHA1 family bicyclomycin/chloramphenicol resistance-like MFS transporter
MEFTSWRGVFVVLAALGAVLVVAVAIGLGETLSPGRRQRGGLAATLQVFRRLLTDRSFVGFALSGGLAIGAMFAYIAGSPFVLQNVYGASPQLFSLIFGTNALGIMAVGQLNRALIGRHEPIRLLAIGLAIGVFGGLTLLAAVATGIGGLPLVLASLFLVVASLGMVLPNSSALALAGDPSTAGSASALLGLLQFAVGALAAPLVGLGGDATALPMAIAIAALGSSGLIAFRLLAVREQAPARAV